MIARRLGLLLLVLVPAVLAAAVAFAVVGSRETTYERTMVFVIRPSPELDPTQVPDAVRGVGEESSQVVFTVARVMQTEPFRGAFGPPGSDLALEASVAPATNVIEATVSGPDEDGLRRAQEVYVSRISTWVELTYPAYRLDLLESTARAGSAQSAVQVVALAALLGLLLGLLALLLLTRRGDRGWPPALRDERRPDPDDEVAFAGSSRAPVGRGFEP